MAAETYQPLRISLPISDPRVFDEVIQQQFQLDGIVRACEIGGLLQALHDRDYLGIKDFSGKAVNLGAGSGADIIAGRKLGLEATGIDNRYLTKGYAVGPWCPIPEFTRPEWYKEIDAETYLEEQEDNSLAMVTAFDANPSLLSLEVLRLANNKLREGGKFVITSRDFASVSDASPVLPPDDWRMIHIITNEHLGDYELADWFVQLGNEFSVTPAFISNLQAVRSELLQLGGDLRGKKRDRHIIIGEKGSHVENLVFLN